MSCLRERIPRTYVVILDSSRFEILSWTQGGLT